MSERDVNDQELSTRNELKAADELLADAKRRPAVGNVRFLDSSNLALQTQS